MDGTFACPECGAEVVVSGVSPGRQVRCTGCSTLVEVPFLPRDGGWTRPRFRKRRPAWLIRVGWATVGLGAILVAIVAAGRIAGEKARARRNADLREIVRAADEAEAAGRPGRALSEVEAAIRFLERLGPEGNARRAALAGRRDELSVREARARLAASTTREPAEAVGDLLGLQARIARDRALEPLATTISAAIESARIRQADGLLAGSRTAIAAGRSGDGLAAIGRAMEIAERREAAASRRVAAEAEAIAAPVLAEIGVVVHQGPGTYSLGNARAYDDAIVPTFDEALRARGFAPRPPSGPARAVWDRHAVYRLEFAVVELQEALYLQSKSRLSEIRATLSLTKRGAVVWSGRASGRTEVPLPGLSAYVAGRLAVSEVRDPETERRLYDDARRTALGQVANQARGLPGSPP